MLATVSFSNLMSDCGQQIIRLIIFEFEFLGFLVVLTYPASLMKHKGLYLVSSSLNCQETYSSSFNH